MLWVQSTKENVIYITCETLLLYYESNQVKKPLREPVCGKFQRCKYGIIRHWNQALSVQQIINYHCALLQLWVDFTLVSQLVVSPISRSVLLFKSMPCAPRVSCSCSILVYSLLIIDCEITWQSELKSR